MRRWPEQSSNNSIRYLAHTHSSPPFTGHFVGTKVSLERNYKPPSDRDAVLLKNFNTSVATIPCSISFRCAIEGLTCIHCSVLIEVSVVCNPSTCFPQPPPLSWEKIFFLKSCSAPHSIWHDVMSTRNTQYICFCSANVY